MVLIAYHASHEQFSPSDLLRFVALAESAGFHAINSSDHFHPWSERQGQSGFAFAWLGAAMQITSLPFTLVCAPGQRYHPAIVAQAIATLCEMFPRRFGVALGSGEALNEKITGDKWPLKSERNARLTECFHVIQKLLCGETVTHKGLINVEHAKLYTRPQHMPLLAGAAVTSDTARWLGSWADGLMTISGPLEQVKRVVEAFRAGGGSGKPMYLKVQLSYAQTKREAMEGAFDQWRTNVFAGSVLGDLWKVEHFDALGEHVQRDHLEKMVIISDDFNEFISRLNDYIDLGFDRLILHNVNRNQEAFIKDFGKHVLPELK